MGVDKNIGERIKALRTGQKLTLKEVSAATDLSIGYLSQLERGLTSIAQDTLKKVAAALGADADELTQRPARGTKPVIRSYEREVLRVDGSSIIEYAMTNLGPDGAMFPRLVEIRPQRQVEEGEPYAHEGEEFVYVLEGILTLTLGGETTDLYPGDGAHYKSTVSHNWCNLTNRVVKFITVNTPNFLR